MRAAIIGVLIAAGMASLGPAHAEGGCGPGWHRGYYGRCYRNAVAVVPGGVVVERPVVIGRPIVVERRACPYGFGWRYGRCRPI